MDLPWEIYDPFKDGCAYDTENYPLSTSTSPPAGDLTKPATRSTIEKDTSPLSRQTPQMERASLFQDRDQISFSPSPPTTISDNVSCSYEECEEGDETQTTSDYLSRYSSWVRTSYSSSEMDKTRTPISSIRPREKSHSSFLALSSLEDNRSDWENLVTQWPHPDVLVDINLRLRSKSGIHPAVRWRFWRLLIFDLVPKTMETRRTFPLLLEKISSSKYLHTVEKDLHRTAPSEEFRALLTPPRIDSLRRVLLVYSLFDHDLGYCQGMNFIAFMFLIFLDEEDSFWGMVAILYGLNLRGLFLSHSSLLFDLVNLVFEENQIQQPDLAAHFEKEGILSTMFAMDWLSTLFVYSLSLETCQRIWDILLFDGSREGVEWLFKVAIGILKIMKERLLSWDLDSTMSNVKKQVLMIPPAVLLASAVDVTLSPSTISKIQRIGQTNPQCSIQ